MRNNLWVRCHWVLLGALALGCGGNDNNNAGATCTAVTACGGTLDGTWTIDSVCTEGDLVGALNAMLATEGLPAACDNMVQSATLGGTGTVTFANGSETDNITTTMTGSLLYTAACESAVAGTTVTLTASSCSTVQSTLTGASGGFTTASCSLSGGNCACDVTQQQQAPTAPQTYTISGGTLTYTAANGGSMQYCVSGTSLTAQGTLTGLANIMMIYVAHKVS